MKKEKCVIVIPVHRPDPAAYELISFEQCYRVLGHHPISIIAPIGMDLGAYQKVIPRLNIKRVDPLWMSSQLNYHKLKLSSYFYKLFSQYEYLLTYELDAFVFEDRLNYWCDQQYDYIGAPRFEGHDEKGEDLIGVGNSGFSLRRIQAITKGLKTVYYNEPGRKDPYSNNQYINFVVRQVQNLRNALSGENTTLQQASSLNEDWVIAELIAKRDPDFKVSPLGEAMHFSFEVKPEALFEMNGRHLPMGCNAWQRCNPSFWKPYIENFGYQL